MKNVKAELRAQTTKLSWRSFLQIAVAYIAPQHTATTSVAAPRTYAASRYQQKGLEEFRRYYAPQIIPCVNIYVNLQQQIQQPLAYISDVERPDRLPWMPPVDVQTPYDGTLFRALPRAPRLDQIDREVESWRRYFRLSQLEDSPPRSPDPRNSKTYWQDRLGPYIRESRPIKSVHFAD